MRLKTVPFPVGRAVSPLQGGKHWEKVATRTAPWLSSSR